MKLESMPKAVLRLFFALFLCSIIIPGIASAYEIEIDVSPNVLNIGSNSTVVTVHTDIAFSLVSGISVTLNGVPIDWWKADDRGYFVAKFNSVDVKNLEGLTIGDYNTLVLSGTDTGGTYFRGEQEILVVNVEPKGK